MKQKIKELENSLARLSKKKLREVTIQLDALRVEVAKLAQQEKEAQASALAMRNLQTTVNNQTATIATAPQILAFTLPNTANPIQSSGITSPQSTPQQTFNESIRNALTPTNAHIVLTACGFEPTVIGAACGIVDGTLYLFQGRWGDSGLSILSSVPFIGATADGAKAGKLALEIAEKARVAKETAKILNQINNVTLSVRATEVFNDTGRTVPVSILKEVIKIFNRLPDPQNTSAYMYYSKVFINGKYYNLEVLYDSVTNQIWHFKYTPNSLGNLPAIN